MELQLDPTEQRLLARIADGDDEARAVLADFWIEHGDEPRGAFLHLQREREQRPDDPALIAEQAALWSANGERWRARVLEAGFPRAELVIERGFLRTPLILDAGDALDGDASVFRMSPVVYRVSRSQGINGASEILEARRATAAGDGERVFLKVCNEPMFHGEEIIHPDPWARIDTIGYALKRDGRALVMLRNGSDLLEVLARAREQGLRLGVELAVSVAAALAARLAPTHRLDAVHKMIGPKNVLVSATGTLTLLDIHGRRRRSPGARDRSYMYMSTEQVRGRQLDPCTDVFSIAMLACELVDNEHPVRDVGTDFDILLAIRDERFTLPYLPPPIERVFKTALATRDDRYATAGELHAALVAAAREARLDIGPHVIAHAMERLDLPSER